MATKTVLFLSKIYVPVRPCQQVVLCLGEGWDEQTATGYPIIVGTVDNTGRDLGPGGWDDDRINPRDAEVYEYSISYDDAQVTVDDETFDLTCEDITEIAPYACIFQTLLNAIVDLG